MKKMRMLLALLVVLWGAPALAQSDADAMDGGAAAESQEAVGEEDAVDGVGAPDEEDVDDVANLGEQADAGTDEALDPWTFDAVDTNDDDVLTADEFGTGLYGVVSADEDGLSEESFVQVVETFGIDPEQHSFANTDRNADELVTAEDEFVPGVGTQVFNEFDLDQDAVLSRPEYATGWLNGLDVDDNGLVSVAELERSAEWFGEPGIEGIAGGGVAEDEAAIDEDFFLGGIDATEEQDIGGPGDETEDAN